MSRLRDRTKESFSEYKCSQGRKIMMIDVNLLALRSVRRHSSVCERGWHASTHHLPNSLHYERGGLKALLLRPAIASNRVYSLYLDL